MASHFPRGLWLRLSMGSLSALILLGATAPAPRQASPASPSLSFGLFARTGLPLADVLWTGTAFLYTGETQRTIVAGDSSGGGLRPFATVPANRGEMRCVPSPGVHGFTFGNVYCHAADGAIYRMSSDGRTVTLLARLPTNRPTDGALTVDTNGAFGYALLAATGGSDSGPGGAVFAIAPDGRLRMVGTYSGPGGAENVTLAPPSFGPAAGAVILTVDQHDHHGRLLAMDNRGRVRTIVQGLHYGLNPVVAITARSTGRSENQAVMPGLYLTDWSSHDVFFAPAAQFRTVAGAVLTGTELDGLLYMVRWTGTEYRALPVETNLHARHFNLEGALYLGG